MTDVAPPVLHPVVDLVHQEMIPPPAGPNSSAHEAPAQVKSVAKAAKVLRCFGPDTAALTVRDIAARTGLPRSTCHAIAATLVAENLLETRPGGGYVLGVEMMVMGGQVVARSGLVDAATPIMNTLAATTSSEVHLGHLDDDGHIVYLHRVRVCHRIRARNWFGLRLPAHTTACGKAALTTVEPTRVRALVLAHGLTPEHADRLADELHHARTTGYALSTTSQHGLASLAAPILRHDGHLVGAISVADRRETFTRHRITTLATAVRDAADTITHNLHGPPCSGSRIGPRG